MTTVLDIPLTEVFITHPSDPDHGCVFALFVAPRGKLSPGGQKGEKLLKKAKKRLFLHLFGFPIKIEIVAFAEIPITSKQTCRTMHLTIMRESSLVLQHLDEVKVWGTGETGVPPPKNRAGRENPLRVPLHTMPHSVFVSVIMKFIVVEELL